MTYIGKDLIHEGCGLELDPERVWAGIAHSARKNIRKAERAGFTIERKQGTPEELEEMRRLWYLPGDPNFPRQLRPDDVFFMAYREGRPEGGVILVPVGSHLFLNNLTASESGKRDQLQGYLLWHVVQELRESPYRYIDVGVSYRPNLYRFFKKWSTFHYPILFHPPALAPAVRFTPFQRLTSGPSGDPTEEQVALFCGERPWTLVPDVTHAREIARRRGWRAADAVSPGASTEPVEIVDLTLLLPVQHGALLVGRELSPQELWDEFGCYDHFKTLALRRVLAQAAGELPEIRARREAVRRWYRERFEREDGVEARPLKDRDSYGLILADAAKLEERYRRFQVEVIRDGDALHFPCHQELREEDVNYVYAIYRGHLNRCSEWLPTHVRGRLKDEEPAQREREPCLPS